MIFEKIIVIYDIHWKYGAWILNIFLRTQSKYIQKFIFEF